MRATTMKGKRINRHALLLMLWRPHQACCVLLRAIYNHCLKCSLTLIPIPSTGGIIGKRIR
jgi:hypothetical protein